MNKMNYNFDEDTITKLFKRRRTDGRYYAKSVIRSAELTKVFNVDTNLQAYLCHLIDGYLSPDWMPACNRRVRHLLERYFSKAIVSKYNHEIKPNGMKLYHVTLVFEEFVTGDRDTNIDWPAIKKKVSTLMRRLSADFIGMGEIDVLLNKSFLINGVSQGRVLCPHFHVLFWTAVRIKTETLSKELSKPFDESPTGMKAVKITTCKDSPVILGGLRAICLRPHKEEKLFGWIRCLTRLEPLKAVGIVNGKAARKAIERYCSAGWLKFSLILMLAS